jgi:Cu-processing system permease protein
MSALTGAKIPGTFRVTRAIGKVTFFEILRDRVLYNVLLIAALLLLIALLVSQLSFVSPDRVILNFGVSAVSLSCSLLGIILGASVLNREFERRTIYVALSRPISRAQFVVGKYFGVAGMLLLNWALICLVFLLLYLGASGLKLSEFLSQIRSSLGAALFLFLLQSWIAAGIALAFSTYSSTAVSTLLSLGCYLIGTNISELRTVASQSDSLPIKILSQGVSHLMPNFEYFNLKEKVTYALPVTGQSMAWAIVYAALWLGVSLLLASLFVRTKEV